MSRFIIPLNCFANYLVLLRKQYVFDPFVPKPAAFPEGELREVSDTIPSKIEYFRSLRAEADSFVAQQHYDKFSAQFICDLLDLATTLFKP